MVPRSSQNPFPLREFFGVLADAARKFLRRSCIAQMNAADFSAAAAEMHVSVNKTGEDTFTLGINLLGSRAYPLGDFHIGAYRDDAVSVERDGFCLGMGLVYGPDAAVEDHHVG
jgi:hypothetical protein